jgi:1,4-dihydroxy-2-naphthoate octaprenyltransferase
MTVSLVLLGGAYAHFMGLRPDLYALSLAVIAALLLHAGANILNDINDASGGIDALDSPTAIYREHPILKGEISMGSALKLSLAAVASGLLLGAYVSYITGLSVFLLELAGAILLASYNGPLANMKAIGIGEFEVSLIWGPLLVLGGFAASARGMLTVQVLLVSLLPGMMMISLIYANNYRDIVSDSRAGVRSFAYRTQKHGNLIYNLCLFAPYALGIVFALFRIVSAFFFLTFLTLPYAVRLQHMFKSGALDIDSREGTLFTIYNLLLIVAVLI